MKKRKFLSQVEIEQLISAVHEGKNSIRDRCLLLMCFIHGLRVSELRSLRLQDIDLTTNRVHIFRLKNGFSVQHPIQPRERHALLKWLDQRSSYLEADSQWLFLSRHGGQISRQQLYRLMRMYGEMAGISVQVHPHMLRHSCGYALADRGVDTRLIQDYLGHKNIQNTVIYTATNVERFRIINI
ncbi:tyrosine-type DNA invertase [Serratia plymuthica]|jgi:type 1 fimbriae regulatory protein FimB|uniref:tyrosine-type DNA invertase n=1 Tax=Serratia TaxID=613 RepID=UPI00020E9EC4|nr:MULTISPECIES: tyrosine-type DNA invertase [Serratia]AEF47136.1 integrase family protein [Serratia plymuthica AS9]AEF52088.1 integrase family protein [Serratia sp. AS12]AEG29795.1 integrase family protein [Serratia sp. AS13]AHY08981.1 integrase [Serratia plymuthica]MBL3524465.1 tyrosine-type recombinase/integrase [Serratia plymuthica]